MMLIIGGKNDSKGGQGKQEIAVRLCNIIEGERDQSLFGNSNIFTYLDKLFFHHYVSIQLWKKRD